MPDFNRIAARRYHAAREASRVSFSRFEVFTFGGATVAAVAAAFLAGALVAERSAPMDSELATAQVLSGDVNVRWTGYGCGNDGATLVTREMPDLSECREVRLLSDSASFERPR
jgi:hypothetical protein